jgi:hypothetical protein
MSRIYNERRRREQRLARLREADWYSDTPPTPEEISEDLARVTAELQKEREQLELEERRLATPYTLWVLTPGSTWCQVYAGTEAGCWDAIRMDWEDWDRYPVSWKVLPTGLEPDANTPPHFRMSIGEGQDDA